MNFNVGKDKDYSTLRAAFDAVPADYSGPVEIVIDEGIYHEKLAVHRPNVRLKGAGKEKTRIYWNDGALTELPGRGPMGTFNSYTLYIGGDNFFAQDLCVENGAGPGDTAGQAVAVYADADRVHFRHCNFMGRQDTLCTGPLPIDPPPRMPEPIHSLRSFEEGRLIFHQFYENCSISGDIDFIFGSARAVFQNCRIESLRRGEGKASYITAASHPEWEPWGYTFLHCILTGPAHERSVYLGRPWRNYGKVSFWNCSMGEHIHPQGWHNWGSLEKERRARFLEANSSGPGAIMGQRVSWAAVLQGEEYWPPELSDIFPKDFPHYPEGAV